MTTDDTWEEYYEGRPWLDTKEVSPTTPHYESSEIAQLTRQSCEEQTDTTGA